MVQVDARGKPARRSTSAYEWNWLAANWRLDADVKVLLARRRLAAVELGLDCSPSSQYESRHVRMFLAFNGTSDSRRECCVLCVSFGPKEK